MTSITMSRSPVRQSRKAPEFDLLLVFIGFFLLGFGMLMVTSASLHLGDRIGSPFYSSWKHLFSCTIPIMPRV